MRKTILLVDKDDKLSEMLNNFIIRNGCIMYTAFNNNTIFSLYKTIKIDLVIMNIDLPFLNAIKVLICMLEVNPLLIVVLLTEDKLTDSKIVEGYSAGATYIFEKPISINLIEIVLGKLLMLSYDSCNIEFNGHNYSINKRRFETEEIEIDLTEREAKLLSVLMNNLNKLVTRQCLLQLIWYDDAPRNNKSLDNIIYNLKKKLKCIDNVLCIRNEYSRGYSMIVRKQLRSSDNINR